MPISPNLAERRSVERPSFLSRRAGERAATKEGQGRRRLAGCRRDRGVRARRDGRGRAAKEGIEKARTCTRTRAHVGEKPRLGDFSFDGTSHQGSARFNCNSRQGLAVRLRRNRVKCTGSFEPFGYDYGEALHEGVFLRFPGQWDDESWARSSAEPGYYDVNRWYGAEIGRYSRPDPLGFTPEDPHLFSYVGGSPVLFTDPLGLRKPIIGAGKFCVGKNCSCNQPLFLLDEDRSALVLSPAAGQCVEADAVYMATGVLKIPDNFRCTLKCRPGMRPSIECSARPVVPGKNPVFFDRGHALPNGWPTNPLRNQPVTKDVPLFFP